MKTPEILTQSTKIFGHKWSITLRIIPIILVVALLKFVAHWYNWEVMELNALFTSLVAGTIFLIGFLITGVLSDYKESEKLPSELAASIKTLMDDTYTVYKTKNSEKALEFMEYQKELLNLLMDWFYKRTRTQTLLQKISGMNDYFAEFDLQGVQANYIIKMKNEQNSLRKMVLRIDTIRDTGFVGSAYAIVEIMAIVIALGLVSIKIEPFYASLFFTLLVTFLVVYMLLLIKDIDDPFDYAVNGEGGTEISLKPLNDLCGAVEEGQ
jgi:hypothetical protein